MRLQRSNNGLCSKWYSLVKSTFTRVCIMSLTRHLNPSCFPVSTIMSSSSFSFIIKTIIACPLHFLSSFDDIVSSTEKPTDPLQTTGITGSSFSSVDNHRDLWYWGLVSEKKLLEEPCMVQESQEKHVCTLVCITRFLVFLELKWKTREEWKWQKIKSATTSETKRIVRKMDKKCKTTTWEDIVLLNQK